VVYVHAAGTVEVEFVRASGHAQTLVTLVTCARPMNMTL
jgi:hypothetical protein